MQCVITHNRFSTFNTIFLHLKGRGDTLAPRDGTNYFEKVCLRGEISGCQDKAWAFERMPGFQLVGHNTKELTNIPSRRDCEEFCLRERGFPCRSAEYNSVTLDCVLSRETRRSRPGSYREARNWDYLENGCISTRSVFHIGSFKLGDDSKLLRRIFDFE